MISIQCDEHVKSAIIKGLKARGLIVYGVEDENLKGISDKDLLEHCIKTCRVLLTNDDDFLSMASDKEHHGIIFITTQFASVGNIIRAVIKLSDIHSENEFRNSRFFVP